MLTSDGIEGYGEFTLEGHLESTRAGVHAMAEWFTGKPTDDLKGLVRGFYGQSRGPAGVPPAGRARARPREGLPLGRRQ